MTHEVHKVVRESGGLRVVIANSATSITEDNKNDIVVDASHCGANIADYVLKGGARGMIGNDAGIGLENAGVACLEILNKHGIPAAAVASKSAEIGVGISTYEDGVISVVNETAKKMGVTVGMTAKEAADKMFETIAKIS
jgi:uncharacterized protein YunC (DUF1805 family)